MENLTPDNSFSAFRLLTIRGVTLNDEVKEAFDQILNFSHISFLIYGVYSAEIDTDVRNYFVKILDAFRITISLNGDYNLSLLDKICIKLWKNNYKYPFLQLKNV